jgi:hypothetical protein
MAVESLVLERWLRQLDESWFVYVKRLSSNDTGLTGSHQVGIYLPKAVMERVFPGIQRVDVENPDYLFPARIVSHNLPEQELRAIYYNNKPRNTGTRNEQRITRWNTGVAGSPIQDCENTGALCVLAFHCASSGENADVLEVWVCHGEAEEELVESYTGEVVPGQSLFGHAPQILGGLVRLPEETCDLGELPREWVERFPDGATIIEHVVRRLPASNMSSDQCLLARRACEYAVFRAVEEMHILDVIRKGFASVDEFVDLANSVSNRRKSRSGRSLELHLERIFREEGLNDFGTQCVTEERKMPDFIFPSCDSYHDATYPHERLRMLAVKTTCKDRWRQILNEGDRIRAPFLFTLQEGVSENQFREMEREGVTLVVPEPLHDKFPESIRPRLVTLAGFIQSTKDLYR